MPLLPTIPEAEAGGQAAELYAGDIGRLGFVANYTRAFSTKPAVYAAWRQLISSITADMDPHLYEVATLGAATALRSTYCSLAHGRILATGNLGAQGVMRLIATAGAPQIGPDGRMHPRAAELGSTEVPAGGDARDVTVFSFAARVALSAPEIGAEDVQSLRAVGLGDDEILGVILAAAARCSSAPSWMPLGLTPTRPSTTFPKTCATRSSGGARCPAPADPHGPGTVRRGSRPIPARGPGRLAYRAVVKVPWQRDLGDRGVTFRNEILCPRRIRPCPGGPNGNLTRMSEKGRAWQSEGHRVRRPGGAPCDAPV